jgi:hypothetical protein
MNLLNTNHNDNSSSQDRVKGCEEGEGDGEMRAKHNKFDPLQEQLGLGGQIIHRKIKKITP